MFTFAYYIVSTALCSLAAFLLTRRYYLAELRHLKLSNALDRISSHRSNLVFLELVTKFWQARLAAATTPNHHTDLRPTAAPEDRMSVLAARLDEIRRKQSAQ